MQQQHNNREEKLWTITKDYKKGYSPDVEQGLSALKGRIAKHTNVPTPVISMKTWLMRAASIALLLVGGITIYQNVSSNSTSELVIFETSDAVASVQTMPDGSQIWLNKHSKVSYPVTFSGQERVIQLEGEAYLKVTSRLEQPFIVETAEATVKVLGTAFDIRAYPSEKEVSVSVAEGKVSFEAPSTGKNILLTAKEKGTYQKTTQELVKMDLNQLTDLSWKDERLVFDETPVTEILSYLTEQFNIAFVTSEEYSTCSLTATLVDNNPDAILNRITTTFPIKAKPMGIKKYQLSGKCK